MGIKDYMTNQVRGGGGHGCIFSLSFPWIVSKIFESPNKGCQTILFSVLEDREFSASKALCSKLSS